MNNLKYKIVAIILVCGLGSSINAQVSVSSGFSADDLVLEILGTGVEYSNAVLTCPTVASGTFEDGGIINIDEGILLTSGDVALVPGPNNSYASTKNNNAPGDADLDSYVGGFTRDACVLEFDFVPNGSNISFNYVFASEEYEEYFCSVYNDAFAFLLSGPDPNGGSYVNNNLALIPGTNTVVAINNVGPGDCNGVNNSGYYNNNFNSATLEYDGYLAVLSATANTLPCETYHIKLAIADRFDYVLDSGVFIEKGSFVSVDITADIDVTDNDCFGGQQGAIDLTITSGIPPYTYEWSNGATTEDISGLTAGVYKVTVNDCSDTEVFTVVVNEASEIMISLDDCHTVYYGYDPDACVDLVASAIGGTGGYTYLWSTGETSSTIEVCPTANTSYTLEVTDDNGCVQTAETIVESLDVRCGNKNKKVLVTHIPPGNPNNPQQICIAKPAVAAHLNGGPGHENCYLGHIGFVECEDPLTMEVIESTGLMQNHEEEIYGEHTHGDHGDGLHNHTSSTDQIQVYPNPIRDIVHFEIYQDLSDEAQILLLDIRGNVIVEQTLRKDQNSLDVSQCNAGIYIIRIQDQGTFITNQLISKQ